MSTHQQQLKYIKHLIFIFFLLMIDKLILNVNNIIIMYLPDSLL